MNRTTRSAIGLLPIALPLLIASFATRSAESTSTSKTSTHSKPAPPKPDSEAWNSFCDRLKATGGEILRSDLPASDLDRAERQRHLLQRLAAPFAEALDAEAGPPIVTLYSHKLRLFRG